jgi:heat shock protein HslJ
MHTPFSRPRPSRFPLHSASGGDHRRIALTSRLALRFASLALVTSLAACAMPKHPDVSAPPTDPYNPAATQLLDDTQWELTRWTDAGGHALTIPHGDNGQPITLAFSTEGGKRQASGYSGCNRYTGSYDLKDGKLTFGPLAGTRMACLSGPGAALEGPYLKGLEHIGKTGVQMNPPQELQITFDTGEVLTFARRGK